MVKLLFSDGYGLPGALVRTFTWCPYSHIEFLLPDNMLLGAQPFSGVGYVKLEDRLNDARQADVFVFDEADYPSVLSKAHEQVGKPYDLMGVIGLGLHRDWHQTNAWWCSEFVAYACLRAGFPLLRDQPGTRRITPRDVLLSPLLKFDAKLIRS